MFRAGEKQYMLARVGLVRAACPRELEQTRDNLRLDKAIMIEANVRGLGKAPGARWVPPCVIVAGQAQRKYFMERGIVHGYAYIQIDAVGDIRADDEISSNELMQKLQAALNSRILGPNFEDSSCCTPGMATPYILEVYPFENYFIYNLKGQKYRQRFFLDPVARVVRLFTGSQKVEEKFVDASIRQPKSGEIAADIQQMPRVETGLRYSSAPVAGNEQTSTRGAGNSELVTCIVRNWKNVLEAVAMYLNAIRNGQHKPPMSVPSFAPVVMPVDGKLQQAITRMASAGINVYDFATWSAAEQDREPKTKEGLPAKSFAYVGDHADTSTWHLKIHDAAHVRNALARLNQVQGIPAEKKPAVLGKLHKLAKHHGIDVQEKPTGKQRSWMKKGKVAA